MSNTKVKIKKQRNFLKVSFDFDKNKSEEIGFIFRSMVFAPLPHSKPKKINYTRTNNNFVISIIGNKEVGGIPYGTYPRIILSWFASEIVKKKSREIVLGKSLSNFMKNLGLLVTGGKYGTINRFKDQLKKIFSSHISFSYQDLVEGKWVMSNINIVDHAQIFLNSFNSYRVDFFSSKIIVGESFYDEVIKAPIPVDIRAIHILKESSLALDIYFWLTYRMSYLSAPVEITFDRLRIQFGVGYKDTYQGRYEFKRKFIIQLKKVIIVYPKVKIKISINSIFLYPSPTHILKKNFKYNVQ